MTAVFERKQSNTNTSVMKPPRADVKFSAAEVRENALLDNQEQVLRVQL